MSKKTIVATMAMLLLAAIVYGAGMQYYSVKETPHGDDLLLGIDVADTTDSPSGTTKNFKIDDLPISAAVATALGLKQDALTAGTDYATPAQLDEKVDLEITLAPSDMTAQGGMQMWGNAGEAMSAFRLVYKKTDSKYYLFDADAADIASWPVPVAMTITAAAAADDTVDLVTGVFFLKCSDFTVVYATYGGMPMYASTTAGEMTAVAPATAGDKRIIVGHVWGADRYLMSLPAMVDVEVP